jgi:hypothetical protein
MMQVVIANGLRDGRVAFLDAKGQWARFIDDARIAHSEDEAVEILAIAQKCEGNNEVIDPQLIDVTDEGGALTPTKLREAIRAKGPTIRPDLGKQAER